jgi:RNA polymerase sigma factor (sigma-70 family)
MAEEFPSELSQLIGATDSAARDAAWATFLNSNSRLLLHVTRQVGRDYDQAMDAYAYVLEQLRADDCRRLRAYVADGRGKFSTWLVVVARRLCLDHYRQRYGRTRASVAETENDESHASRRRLVDLLVEAIDPAELTAHDASNPETELQASELCAALAAALAGLSGSDRLLLTLRIEDDLPAREIARVMGFPTPFHVYRRLNTLFESLRAVLRQRGVEDATP